MGKHFYQQYKSEKTGKIVKSNLPSYCGGTPAVPFEWQIMSGWCPDCMAMFEGLATGSIGEVLSKMSAPTNEESSDE